MAIRNHLPEISRRTSSWNPIREINHLQRRLDRIFDDLSPFETFPSSLKDEDLNFAPACDIQETDSRYLVTFDLPGVKKDDVKIELRDNQLTVSGERNEEHKTEKSNHLSEERFYGSFYRAFTLPSNVQEEQVSASFDNGVLNITIPKAAGAKSKQIPIKDSSKTIEKKAA